MTVRVRVQNYSLVPNDGMSYSVRSTVRTTQVSQCLKELISTVKSDEPEFDFCVGN